MTCPESMPAQRVIGQILKGMDKSNVHSIIGPEDTAEGKRAIIITNKIVALATTSLQEEKTQANPTFREDEGTVVRECFYEGTTHYVQVNTLDRDGLEAAMDGMGLRWSIEGRDLFVNDLPEKEVQVRADARVAKAVSSAKARDRFLSSKNIRTAVLHRRPPPAVGGRAEAEGEGGEESG